MKEKKKTLNTPNDVMVACEFRVERFPTEDLPIGLYIQNNWPMRCGYCHDEYDPEEPDSVELVQLKAIVIFNIQDENGEIYTIPYPWASLYCKHCMLAIFGQPADAGVAQMFQ
jgi:Fe-S-cluster-containing dehydrogenase component